MQKRLLFKIDNVCKIAYGVGAGSFLADSPILFELQHGFTEKRFCETPFVMLVDEIAKNTQIGKKTDLILLDFSKAFDKVAHEKLISKLRFYEIRGKILSWVKDFWNSRSQAVVLNGVKSDKIALSLVSRKAQSLVDTLPSIYK